MLNKKRRLESLLFYVSRDVKLLHDELLSVRTSADEVHAAVQAAEVDAVGTNMAFKGTDDLTHEVVNRDFSVLAFTRRIHAVGRS